MATARRANTDIVAAAARVRQADALATVAGAALLPNLGLNATVQSARLQSTNTGYTDLHQGTAQLAASYMVDFWSKNRAAQTAAIATAAASRHDAATIELTVLSGVALTYFQSIELRDRVAVAQANVLAAQTTMQGLRRQQAAGIATALDVAQQETTVALLNAAIPPLRQQLRQSVHALAILIGQAPESLDLSTLTMAECSLPAVQAGVPSELIRRRPDLAEAEDRLVSAKANIALARAALFPSITLTASGGYASAALSTLLDPASRVHALTAGLVQPIFDGGVLHGQYEYATAYYDELVASYRKTVLTALGEVEDALVGVQQTAEAVQRQTLAVSQARRAYEIAQAQLHSGTVSILTVLNTQTALFTAQDALTVARFSQVQALIALYSALGGGWQKTAAPGEPDA